MGWFSTLWTLALTVLAPLPLGKVISTPASTPRTASPRGELAATLRAPLKNKNYICLHIGFFTCGFHVAFLTTHLPGEVAACGIPEHVASTSLALIGLFTIAGSLAAGWLGTRIRMKYVLAGLYASRTIMILIFMVSPKNAVSFYIFALFLGLTWLATVPPTSGLVGKTFGVRYLATLFGLTLLSHQVGGFLGAFLGGWFMQHNGSYTNPLHHRWCTRTPCCFIKLAYPRKETRPIEHPHSESRCEGLGSTHTKALPISGEGRKEWQIRSEAPHRAGRRPSPGLPTLGN